VDPIRITLVPHTHWDREWYGPFDEFRARLVAMMDTLVELGNAGFPHFHLDGQTAMIDDYLAVRPEREADIRRLAEDGKLSVGPWVTQMDEFLVSGESHLRNLERGLARARELGRPLMVGYLPDQFGHVGQMPQILAHEGIDRAVVWRGVAREIERTQFWWEAPDGSRVLAEYLAFGYSLGWDIEQQKDPKQLAASLRRKAEHVAPFLASERMLITVGADHTGPDATLPERLAIAQEHLPGMTVRIGSLLEHLDARPGDGLPSWRGELRSSARAHLLPNVYSARADQKRERGRVEALVERYAEPLAALVPGFDWPAEELDRAWTLLLWNGAHDSVCGCSHDQVARDVDARYAEARAIGDAIVARALEGLGSRMGESGTLRFNPSPFEREGVPGLGWRVETGPAASPTPVEAEEHDGWMTAGEIAFTLRDEPDVGDLYNFCYEEQGQRAWSPAWTVAPGSNEVEAVFDEGLSVRMHVVRNEGEPFVRLSGQIENRRADHRLRIHVRLAQPAQGSLAGSPFELVERGLLSEGGELEAPSPTWPARHVVLAGEIAAFHEGVFEYEVDEGELAITLLRCVGTISKQHLATRPFAAGPDVPTPDAQMAGTTMFELGLAAGATSEGLMADWERFALPLREVPTMGGGTLPSSGSLLAVDGDAVLSNVRRKDGVLQVRLWNPSPRRPASARVAGRTGTIGPARIETIEAR
jgi:glycosyl hydrolase family 38/alpha mannosidase-like protein